MAITVAVGTKCISLFVINKRDGSACQLRDVLLDGVYLLHHVIDILTDPVTVGVITIRYKITFAASPLPIPAFPSHRGAGGHRLTE